jgi:hypothetical protein
MGWVVFAIVIIIAIISAVSQVLKSQQEAAAPPRRQRQRSSGSVRSSSGDIDRFLQEIDRLRKRPPGESAAAAPKPKAKKATPARVAVPTVEPARPRRVESPVAPRLEELPVASVVPARVVGPPRAASIASPVAAVAQVMSPLPRRGPTTPFGKNLAAMLTTPQSVPMAFVMQEIIGPPKSQRG